MTPACRSENALKLLSPVAQCFWPRYNAPSLGQVAQLVEQRIENPRVGGSIPPLATKILHAKRQPSPVAVLHLSDRKYPIGSERESGGGE
jgi:hypothetical protein